MRYFFIATLIYVLSETVYGDVYGELIRVRDAESINVVINNAGILLFRILLRGQKENTASIFLMETSIGNTC